MRLSQGVTIGLIVLACIPPGVSWAQPQEGREPGRGGSVLEAQRAGRAGRDGGDARDRPSSGARGHGRGHRDPRDAASQPLVIRPSVISPVMVGGIAVGAPVIVGSPITIGHVDVVSQTATSPRVALPHNAVLFAVAGVLVPTAVVGRNVPSDSRGAVVVAAPYRFTPWYPLTTRLMAGMLVPLSTARRGQPGDTDRTRIDAPADARLDVPYADGTHGGLAFDIAPADAGIYVDNMYVGQAGDFAPASAPLSLPARWHRVELRAPQYQTEAFDVPVSIGHVMPLSGSLERLDGNP